MEKIFLPHGGLQRLMSKTGQSRHVVFKALRGYFDTGCKNEELYLSIRKEALKVLNNDNGFYKPQCLVQS